MLMCNLDRLKYRPKHMNERIKSPREFVRGWRQPNPQRAAHPSRKWRSARQRKMNLVKQRWCCACFCGRLWLVGWLVVWLVSWLVGLVLRGCECRLPEACCCSCCVPSVILALLAGWLTGCGWFGGGRFVWWLACWLVDWLVDWLVGSH